MTLFGRKSILTGSLIIVFLLLFFFGDFLETKTAPYLFRKIVYFRALISFPGWQNDAGQSNPPENILKSEDNPSEALVIFSPPAISYDQLIINQGFKDGIQNGNLVIYSDYILVGKIAETYEDSSRVISFSSYGLEQNVFLEQAGISVIASGKGNGEMTVTLPREFSAVSGDKVLSLTKPEYLIGFVEKIESPVNSPLKTLVIKSPFNIYNLRSVRVLK